MKQSELIKKIKQKAKLDARNRRDPRFLNTLGFFVAKGFLRTNQNVHPLPNQRLRIDDVLWAGKHVEPRILEVFPAALLRLEKHFDFDPLNQPDLALVIKQLRYRKEKGNNFCGIPYEKLRLWVDFPLPDGRVKAITEKRITKTFRLAPQTLSRLSEYAKKYKCSETEILEKALQEKQLNYLTCRISFS